jgi:2-hydroxy-3-oxopropionate reductase
MEKERIGFIGLGVMGRPMAENLIRSGFPLVAYNRSSGPVGELAAIGANAAATAAQVAAESDIIITMLPDTPDVEHVYFGSAGLIHHLRPGTLLIDMTTASPEIARKIHQAALHKGADSLDAPVSGGDIGAQAGTLSIMAGGSGNSFERARPVFEALGKSVVHMGDAGAGQVTKACNQIVVALTIEAVGEALALAKKSGVDPAKVRDALLGGFAQSRVLDVHVAISGTTVRTRFSGSAPSKRSFNRFAQRRVFRRLFTPYRSSIRNDERLDQPRLGRPGSLRINRVFSRVTQLYVLTISDNRVV